MPRHREGPAAPYACEPDLPAHLDDVAAIGPRTEVQQAAIAGLTGDVDASRARLVECRVGDVAAERLDLGGAVLIDVEIDAVRATALRAVAGRWRNVRLTGGRIAALDLSQADVETVELRGARIDYLTLAHARVSDLVVADCALGTVDLPGAELRRVRFDDCRADEVDTRGLRAEDLDLRGLDALAYTDPMALRGATLSPRQVEALSESLAAALGIDVRD
jgi:uncharacterized protein YjbI with pentapeptide repeats